MAARGPCLPPHVIGFGWYRPSLCTTQPSILSVTVTSFSQDSSGSKNFLAFGLAGPDPGLPAPPHAF